MDSQVVIWVCIAGVALMPGVFSFTIVTNIRGGLRVAVLLAVFALPLVAIARGPLCHASGGDANGLCFADDMLAAAGYILGLSALFGVAAGVISNRHRRDDAPAVSYLF